MEFLKGNEIFKEAAFHISTKGKLPHAVLITGEDGSGKKTAAKYLAMSVLCSGQNKPCLSCENCRRIMKGIHPDVIMHSPSDSGMYKVDTIRAIRSDAAVKPNQSEYKFYIIEKADGMNKNAANSLLKCIEEPPTGTVFILLSDDETKLLPTVLSRTVRFKVSPLSLRYFKEEFGEKGESLYTLSSGNLGKARSMKEEREESSFSDLFLTAAINGNTYEVLKLIKKSYMKRPELQNVLGEITVILRNALIAKQLTGGQDAVAELVAASLTEDRIFEIINEIERLQKLLERNISGESILTSLFLKIKE